MDVRILRDGQKPTLGYVRRKFSILPEFARQMTWFSKQEWETNGDPDLIYVWVLRSENRDYERGVTRKRFCKTYRGQVRDVFVSD